MSVICDQPADGVLRIVIDRPERLNALHAEAIAALHAALDEVEADSDSRVLILAGSGRAFCTGLDLRDGYPQIPKSADGRLEWMIGVSRLVGRLRHLDQIVVGAIDGPAYGGGFALALAADLRVASDRAVFCLSQVRFGLLSSEMGAGFLLPRLVGSARAADIMLTGRKVEAVEAERIGLVSAVVPRGEFPAAVLELAGGLAEAPRRALGGTKHLLRAGIDASNLDHVLAAEAQAQAVAFSHPDIEALVGGFRD